jgi:hypothetical protein
MLDGYMLFSVICLSISCYGIAYADIHALILTNYNANLVAILIYTTLYAK